MNIDEQRSMVDSAMQSTVEQEVKMTFGELFLYHLLVQEYGLPIVGDERFIPLMERNKRRLDAITGV